MKDSYRQSLRWSLFISFVTLILSSGFTIASTAILAGLSWAVGMLVVFIIVIIGVFFDMLGLAAAAGDEKPYHAMAAERINGAKHAIQIVRNADKFSNFCNDVIGDIAGIVSGTATASVVLSLVYEFGYGKGSFIYTFLAVLFTAIVAAMTVGGKAIGKTVAINNSMNIILKVGKVFYFLETNFHITIFSGIKNGKRKARGN